MTELETRPAYQFYSQINSAISAGEQATRKRVFWHDVYSDARKQSTLVKAQLTEFKKNILQEELARKQYEAPGLLAKANAEAEKNLADANDKYKLVNDNNEIGKAILIATEASIVSNLQVEEGKLASMRNDTTEDEKKLLMDLRVKQDDLRQSRENVEKAIDKKHPKCFPWRVKKELKELSNIDSKMNAISLQVASLEDGQRGYLAQEKIVTDLHKQLESARQSITAHVAESSALIKAATDAVTQANIKKNQTEIDVQKDKFRQSASISEGAMEFVVKLYASFLNYKNEIDSANSSKIDTSMSSVKDKLDVLMAQLWCPAMNNRCAKDIYAEACDVKPVAKKVAVNH